MNDNQQQSTPEQVDQAELEKAEAKFKRAKKSVWERIVGAFTRVDYPTGHVSPHAGARRKQRDWHKKRKARNRMAACSRKINRRRR